MTWKTRLLVLLAVALASPMRDYPLTAGVDASWVFGVNYAHANGLIFGRDVYFTYGPLAWLAAPMDIGRNLVYARLFQAACWAAFAGMLWWLTATLKIGAARLVAFAICLLAGRRAFQRFDYWGAEVFLLFVALVLLAAATARRTPALYWLVWAIGVLLLFVKFSAGVAVIGAAALVDFRSIRPICAALMFVASYLCYCPSPAALWGYVRSGFELSSGYSTAMSVSSGPLATILAMVVAVSWALLTAALYRMRAPVLPAALAFFAPLFVVFKHSLVREPLHAGLILAFAPLMWGAILLFVDLDRRIFPALAPMLPIACITIGMDLAGSGPVYAPIERDRLPREITVAIGRAPVAIFPHELAYAPANGLDLRPFPVLQAYSAYTPYLDALDAAFVEDTRRAPPFVLFDQDSIDGRHPLLDVPSTALALYRWYDPQLAAEGHTVLRRRMSPRFGNPRPVAIRELRIGQPFAIPAGSRPLIGRIPLRLTPWGAARKFLFRIPEITLSTTRTVRVPPENLAEGIPLNFMPWEPPARVENITIGGPGAAYFRDRTRVEVLELPLADGV